MIIKNCITQSRLLKSNCLFNIIQNCLNSDVAYLLGFTAIVSSNKAVVTLSGPLIASIGITTSCCSTHSIRKCINNFIFSTLTPISPCVGVTVLQYTRHALLFYTHLGLFENI